MDDQLHSLGQIHTKDSQKRFRINGFLKIPLSPLAFSTEPIFTYTSLIVLLLSYVHIFQTVFYYTRFLWILKVFFTKISVPPKYTSINFNNLPKLAVFERLQPQSLYIEEPDVSSSLFRTYPPSPAPYKSQNSE